MANPQIIEVTKLTCTTCNYCVACVLCIPETSLAGVVGTAALMSSF